MDYNETCYTIQRIKEITDKLDDTFSSLEINDIYNAFKRIADLAEFGAYQTKPWQIVAKKFSELTFKVDETEGEVAVTSLVTITRGQAQRIRFQLAAAGLRAFYVNYENNGRIYWKDIQDYPDVFREVKDKYGHLYAIRWSTTLKNTLFLTADQPVTVEIAQKFANDLYKQYPWTAFRIYYNRPSQEYVDAEYTSE